MKKLQLVLLLQGLISNDPNNVQLEYMQDVAELVFEPLRIWAKEPIRINSFLDRML
jgi:hypothetical protein